MPETRVVVVVLEGVVSFDLGIVVQAFARGPGADGALAGFTLTTCGERPGRVATGDGFDLHVTSGLEALRTADLVLLPGRVSPEPRPSPAVVAAVHDAHARGARVGSICVGAFDLAATGLLDGRRATTHWAFADVFAARFPRVELVPDALYVDEGDVLTSAGLAAGMDLCLHVVREQEGAAAAAALARWNVVALHRDGGQAQYVPTPVVRVGEDLAPTLEWARCRLDQDLDARVLAAHAHLSVRTLARRFASEVGTTPRAWVTAQRVALARELLESTDAPVEEVARCSGLGSAPVLRRHLARVVHTTPTRYRATFRGIATPRTTTGRGPGPGRRRGRPASDSPVARDRPGPPLTPPAASPPAPTPGTADTRRRPG